MYRMEVGGQSLLPVMWIVTDHVVLKCEWDGALSPPPLGVLSLPPVFNLYSISFPLFFSILLLFPPSSFFGRTGGGGQGPLVPPGSANVETVNHHG